MFASVAARQKAGAAISSTYRCHHLLRRSSRVLEFQRPTSVRVICDRSFSSQRTQNDLDSPRVLKTDKPLETSESFPNTSTTTSQRIWGYTKQFSSRLFITMKDSASSTITWVGIKVASFAERSKDRITQNIQSSVETTKSNISNKAQVLQERVKSSLRNSLNSLFQTVFGPFKIFGNYVANQWQATPIWNRFFWWSLSAIAVYGIATTLPKEIVKYAIVSTTAVEKPSSEGISAKKRENVISELEAED